MHDEHTHHFLAIFLGAVILAIAGVIVAVLWIRSLDAERVVDVRETILAPFAPKPDLELTRDAVATLGQEFVKMSATYDGSQAKPILFTGAEQQGDMWIATYEVTQSFLGGTQVYYHAVQIRGGRVVTANVGISDEGRHILVTSPQPQAIISTNEFIVKGQVFQPEGIDLPQELSVILTSSETGEVLDELTAHVISEKNGSFVVPYTREADVVGNILITVSDGQVQTLVPVVFSTPS